MQSIVEHTGGPCRGLALAASLTGFTITMTRMLKTMVAAAASQVAVSPGAVCPAECLTDRVVVELQSNPIEAGVTILTCSVIECPQTSDGIWRLSS